MLGNAAYNPNPKEELHSRGRLSPISVVFQAPIYPLSSGCACGAYVGLGSAPTDG